MNRFATALAPALWAVALILIAGCDQAKELAEKAQQQAADLAKQAQEKATPAMPASSDPASPMPAAPTTTAPVPPPMPVAPPPKDYTGEITAFMTGTPQNKNDDNIRYFSPIDEKYRALLTSLDLSGSKVTEVGLAELQKFPNLKQLDLSGMTLTPNGILALNSIAALEDLNLSRSNLTDEAISKLANGNLKKLKLISVGSLTDRGLPVLERFPDLEYLDLSNNANLTGQTLAKVNALGKLKYLNVSYTKMGQFGFNRLKGMKDLEELRASAAEVTDKSLAAIGGLDSLRIAELDRNPGISDAGMKNIGGCGALVNLFLSSPLITDRGLGALVKCKDLETLSLQGTSCGGNGVKALETALKKKLSVRLN